VTGKPGRRDEFVSLVESLVAQHMPSMREAGCLGTTLYAVVDDPDRVVEIAEWESAEPRDAMSHSEAMGAFAPMFDLLAAPFRATVVKPLH
jgi:quinol monooxygenase YgiN